MLIVAGGDWRTVDAVLARLPPVHEHRARIRRVAVVGEPRWQGLTTEVLAHFAHATARYFPPGGRQPARAWAAGERSA